MHQCLAQLILISFLLLLPVPSVLSQEKGPAGRPPAPVVVSEVRAGQISPEAEYVGTVFYPEVSDVAAESNGRIETVNFEDGQRVKRGDLLVRINSDLLEKTLQGTIASHEEVLAELGRAKADLNRIESLYQKKVVPEQLYDENRFKVQGLEKKAASLLAEVERLKIELRRTAIRSPFDGVVIRKLVDRGEWLQPGSAVATMARDDVVDVVVEVPQSTLKLTRLGMDVRVKVIGRETTGKIFAFVPRGDIATRTFPIKVRLTNLFSLVEGMEARVSLPTMEGRKSLVAPRDAVILLSEQTVVFAVIDSKAKMIPVKVIGYQGQMAGVQGEGLSAGMKVVVKGNERLQDGQPVTVLPAK
jgi:RND family efflux transporter MFP subunit